MALAPLTAANVAKHVDGSKEKCRGGWSARNSAFDFTITKPDHLTSTEGKEGFPVNLKTNLAQMHFNGLQVEGRIMHLYHVEFEPSVDQRKERTKLLMQCLVDEGYRKEVIVYNGTVLYLPHKIEGMQDTKKEFAVSSGEGDSKQRQKMSIHWIESLSSSSPLCLPVFNFMTASLLQSLDYHQYGLSFFNPQLAKSCEAFNYKLHVWPGVSSCIRYYDAGLLFNVDQTHKIINQKSVLEIIMNTMKANSNVNVLRAKCQDLIDEQIVMTKYNTKTYRVDQIAFNKSPLSEFAYKGKQITFAEYYKTRYNLDINETTQPMLLCKTDRGRNRINSEVQKTEPIFLVPELCLLVGLFNAQRRDKTLMNSLGPLSRLDPAGRVLETEAMLANINRTHDAYERMSDWGLVVSDTLVRLCGRQLPNEEIVFGKELKITVKNGEWAKEAKKYVVKDGATLKRGQWAIVCMTRDFNLAQRLTKMLTRVAKPVNIKIFEPECIEIEKDAPEAFVEGIREACNRIYEDCQCKPQLILLIVPNDSKERYDAIKQECCIRNPVPSQVVLVGTIRKDKLLESITQKIMHQINCKVGGVPWKVANKFSKLVMHVGYDTYSDASMKHSVVGAAVFSMDRDWTKWYTCADIHRNPHKRIKHIKAFFIEALEEYEKRNQCLPDKMFLWRDSVTEDQLSLVYNVELPHVLEALKQVYHCFTDESLAEKVQFTFTIVNKYTNVRFFLESGEGKYSNPVSGTVVDTLVTRKERFDFFVIPQNVNRGTVTPVNYNVIYDKNMLGPDKMQMLAYKLCHLYFNWQGTIRVPAPCMYAFKAALQIGQALHEPFNKRLAAKLVYI